MIRTLTQSEWDDLSAWIDGELPDVRADEVAARVADDSAWQQAHRQLQDLDAALDAWEAPAPQVDLAERIIAEARTQRQPAKIIRLAIPLTAAAAAIVLIAVGVATLEQTTGPETTPDKPIAAGPPAAAKPPVDETIPETFVVQGVDVFTVTPAPADDLHTRADAITGGSLCEALGGSQSTEERWAQLSGEQQDNARQQAMAFLRMDPDEQQTLLDDYAKAVAEDPEARQAWQQRSRWLKVVIDSFTAQEKQALRDASPAERARLIIRRRQQLRKQGDLD
ncbi:MAG: hypothetical protein GVY16_03775 [Planctomycetes bacterium]|jgi:hypothetical protein|nr:hypothetical protein [Phycisphaerae bacterium]NBB94839.1 hypothetical protein [Planctomycetota bacterium]